MRLTPAQMGLVRVPVPLALLLPTLTLLHRKLAGYGHVDFVWGTTAAADIYEEVLALLAAEGRADQPWRRRN